MNKKHWFCFCFIGRDTVTGKTASASTYTGLITKNISLPVINEQKSYSQLADDAVLMSVSYLGEMTREEFLGEPKKEPYSDAEGTGEYHRIPESAFGGWYQEKPE